MFAMYHAVATFGKSHHWHRTIGALDQSLVYALFPSPTLVPHDVVFSNYNSLGAVRESWTAPCYILSVDFDEVLPADEDQMPLVETPILFLDTFSPNLATLFFHSTQNLDGMIHQCNLTILMVSWDRTTTCSLITHTLMIMKLNFPGI
jgi:hypothetical protein